MHERYLIDNRGKHGDNSDSEGVSTWKIILAVAGCVTGLVFMIAAIVVAAKRKKKPVAKWAHTKRKKHSEQGIQDE